ncbi:MAG TPA: acyl-CoA desaturase [Holophagaceae bacterium]|jgi:stearoyl-CoA desaturase (delta-9 desaturase)|nr:acyl-CoA desaturase [Holophagaceae bacterium]
MPELTPRSWLNTLFLVGTLALALIFVPWKLAVQGLRWSEVAVFLVLYALTGLAITVGYHRLYSHRAFRAAWPVRLAVLILGAAAFENSALAWCSDHRHHHRFVDDPERDPYAIKKGFWYAHWVWVMEATERPLEAVGDLEKDPLVRWQGRYHYWIGAAVTALPVIAAGLATHNLVGQMVIGILLRIVLTHHSTFLINSAAHWFGTQPYSDANSSRDNALLAPFTFGEGYHNFHHMWQWDYRNGPRWYQWDPAKWLIAASSWMGLARGLRRVPATEIQRARVAMEAKRLAATLGVDAAPVRISLETAHARVDQALAVFQSHREAWHVKSDQWKAKGVAKAEVWRAARQEWKAQRARLLGDVRAAWAAWKQAKLQARQQAAA